MADQPRRSRRSSVSEHIHRVLNVDRAEKRHSFVVHSVHSAHRSTAQAPVALNSHQNGPHEPKPENSNATTLGQSTPDETRPGSFTYSSVNSQMPSSGTPDTSPSVHPIRTKDEDAALQTAPADNPNAARDQVCSSPTWEKDITRKERRATKRLEAERKDLEKRLLHLEEAQARLESGIYERTSRRLTKKQPIGSSTRSSSANTERPRSSGGFSSFFSSSRRSSRSRSSSVNGKDLDSRRQSTENPASGPPSLPLVLPERFGAAISRELAAKHGTTLVPSHQLQRSLHTLHSSLKSDDLRESWRMAEAWQKKNGRESDQDLSGKPEVYTGGQNVENAPWKYETRSYSQPTELSADLDRERFAATLRHERRPTEPVRPSVTSGKAAPAPVSMPVKNRNTSSESPRQASAPASSYTTTPRQLRDPTSVGSENMQVSPNSTGSPVMLPAQVSTSIPIKGRVDPNSQAHPRVYKSSPLALNPTTTNDFKHKDEIRMPRAMPVQADYLHVPQPLRVSKPYYFEEPRGRNRAPAPVYPPPNGFEGRQKEMRPDQRHPFNGPMQTPARRDERKENRPMRAGPSEPKQHHIPSETRRPSHVAPPLKHPDRRIPSKELAARRLSDEKHTASPNSADVPAATTPQEPIEHTHHIPGELIENKHLAKGTDKQGHNRSLSATSIKTTSSYDTADEEVLDVPNRPAADRQTQAASNELSTNVVAEVSTPEVSTPKEPGIIPTNLRDPPPLAAGGPIAMLRRKAMQKANPFEPNQVIAKLFVICCHCNYWHDLPSEVYAKLACPERLPSDSLLVRTFSRKNSLGRRNSIFSKPSGSQPLSVTRGLQVANDTQIAGASQGEADSQASPSSQPTTLHRPQCCWCGHSMGKSCCQGWTTIVHMRERHH